jgi:endonuclease/exonuclease/phosphatase family metal-dependent hydrolase
VLACALGVTLGLVVAFGVLPGRLAPSSASASPGRSTSDLPTDDTERANETTRRASRPAKVIPGHVLQRKPRPKAKPKGPVMAAPSYGRAGTGLSLGALTYVDAPVGQPADGTVSAAVANLPNRTSTPRFAASIRTLTAAGPDFLILNEASRHSDAAIQAMAPGYDAYRDPYVDRGAGGGQSLNNVVAWSMARWTLVDAGRVKLVENDTGYLDGRPFTWDRYATWATLQRADGGIVSVVSVHMMTNPGRYPRQPRRSPVSRIQRYAYGMDVLRATVGVLSLHGPVLVGGDMNSHPGQGAWTAAAKLGASGFQYTKDAGVMYLFYPGADELWSSRQVRVASDHPALVATVNLG